MVYYECLSKLIINIKILLIYQKINNYLKTLILGIIRYIDE